MPYNVFVLGLEDLSRSVLDRIERDSGGRYRFHQLLDFQQVIRDRHIDAADLLHRARCALDEFDGPVDGIVIGFWDFPATSMVPLLCAERGLPAPSLESVVKCEHKYWSRLEQQRVTTAIPRFATVDPDAERPPPGLNYPLWVKPVKSYNSSLAFRAPDDERYRSALADISAGIDRLGKPFQMFLDMLDPPGAVSRIGATACLAEEEAVGRQATVEGYVCDGDIRPYAVIDSIRFPGRPSFLCYRYPSTLPRRIVGRLTALTDRVVRRMGLDTTTFNVEYFWDPDTDRVTLLEINPRHSQSHTQLLRSVDGITNHEHAVRLALGLEPRRPRGGGRFPMAAKWYLRSFHDGVVVRSPDAGDIARLEREVPGATARICYHAGTRLSDVPGNDGYSYQLADIYVGADDVDGLRRAYEECAARLPFEIRPVRPAGGAG